MDEKEKRARELFLSGYNCAQSVFCTFCEDFGIDFETGLKLSSSFGGGMGRLREVCGALSALFMLEGLRNGYTEINDNDKAKIAHYKRIQDLAEKFRRKNGSIICRELLGEDKNGYIPEKRTPEYYKNRPCEKIIVSAAEIMEKLISEK